MWKKNCGRGKSDFLGCSDENSVCLSKHGLFKTDASCGQTVFVKVFTY